MKTLLTITAGLLFAVSASATGVESGKQYRIVSNSYPTGTLCIGENHGSSAYLYHNPYYDGTCKDCYWTFTVQSDGSYSIMNAQTREYITYYPTRIEGTAKGLYLSTTDEGAASHWFLEDSGNGYYLYTEDETALENGNNYWNERLDSSYLLGTYALNEGSENELFTFVENTGETVDPTPTPDPDPDPDPQPTGDYTILDGGADNLVLFQTGNRMTVIPRDYVEEIVPDEADKNAVTLKLVNGKEISYKQCESLKLNEFPADADIPSFTSYKFNNKFNYNVPVDAEATDPTASSMTIPVGGIGKWLTASFKLSSDSAVVYIGDTLQVSKETRQRFAKSKTYTVGYPTWKKMEIRQYSNDVDSIAFVPYGRKQTVTIDWLCDHPTTDYGVPRIDITLTDYPDKSWGSDNSDPWGGGGGWGGWGGGGSTTTSGVWIGMNGKSTYENASITIDGAGVYPDMEATPIVIKGRGNSSWSSDSNSKNPYHFKFESGQKPLGLTKGKHWILLANKQTGSMTTNAIGHRIADMMGSVAPCHIIPVELYIQGSYRGSYNLCEKIGFGSNCIDLDDETYAAMVELDTYTDETIYRDDYFNLCTKMKEPDFEDEYEGPLEASTIMDDWNNMVEKVSSAYYGYDDDTDFTPYVKVKKLAAYLSACELMTNCELKHAKSVFAYSENVTDGFSLETNNDSTSWVFGPLWDCDWGFGYEQQKTYFKVNQTADFFSTSLIGGGDSNGNAYKFWSTLRKNSQVDEAYYKIWYEFINDKLPELIDFCDDYYAFASKSFTHNKSNETNCQDNTNYTTTTSNAKSWLETRANSIYSQLNVYDLPVDPVEPEKTYPDPTDPMTFEGLVVGIDEIAVDDSNAASTVSAAKTYDLQGRRAVNGAKGIVVSDGRKSVRK